MRVTRLIDRFRPLALILAFMALIPSAAWAADEGALRGVVRDPLGAAVAGAQISLKNDGADVRTTASGSDGAYAFDGLAPGRYQVQVTASGYGVNAWQSVFVGARARVIADLTLALPAIADYVFVSAAATPVQGAQTGASATVIDADTIVALGNTELLEPMRTVPGVAVVQTGGRGGKTSLFVRGGSANFNKVLVDGVPANDIGGDVDLADLSTAGVASIEVLRGANSVLYGSDAMTGVVNITTAQGRTRTPEARLSLDGGNFGQARFEGSVGGVAKRFDYFVDYAHLQADNDVDNNDYRNDSFASRIGVTAGSNTRITGVLRTVDSESGSPNAVNYYGLSDDSRVAKMSSYAVASAETQITNRWQSTVRLGVAKQDYDYVNPSPTGTPSDSSAFANFLGNTVTIAAPDGKTVTGRAILDYSDSYPSKYNATALRTLLFGQTSYHVSSTLNLAGGARVEHEKGTSRSSFSENEQARNNYGAFAEARASLHERLFVTGGVGFDHNAVFGGEASPRLSVAAYVRPPSSGGLGDTKVTFNAGKGIKEPSVSQELSSLFNLIPVATATTLGVEPVGPERSRTIDVGVEQGLASGHGRVRVAYYHNEYSGILEYVSKAVLPQLGVPKAIADASGYGAYVNAQSNRSKGIEVSGEAVAGPLKVMIGYTYADAVVTESFGSGALFPAENPKFPGIRIGQYAPLVGERPFRRPANSGSLVVNYTREKASVALAGYFFGKADDSTYLSDAFFGYSMLLPNQDLDPGYQKFNLSGSYRVHSRVRAYATIENLFDEDFAAASGFPSLPRSVRGGVTVALGGK